MRWKGGFNVLVRLRTTAGILKGLFSTFVLLTFLQVSAQSLSEEFVMISSSNDVIGGSLVVFCEDGIIENLNIGISDLNRDIKLTANTKYRIASISKTITAIAIMQLIEQNKLSLDDDIGTVLGYPIRNPNSPTIPITVRMLLSHTSTLIDGPTYNAFLTATINENPIPNLSQLLTVDGSFYHPDQFNTTTPGHYFNYSNINYVILGTVVEKVSGLRFDVYCKQHISDPLNIDASFNVNDLSDIDQVAVIYRKFDGVWTPQVDDYQGAQPSYENLTDYVPGTNGGRFAPQGGYRCSAQDLAKLFLALMNGGSYDDGLLLSPESIQSMLADEWTFDGLNGNNYFGLFRSWGLGIHRITSTAGNDVALPGSEQMFGHAGEAFGLVSDAFFDPQRKVGFVFLTNGVGTGYQTNELSTFYTVEQEIFEAIERYGSLDECLNPVVLHQPPTTSKFAVFPNPTSSSLTISGIEPNESFELRILALDGRLIRYIHLEGGCSSFSIEDLEDGLYILASETAKAIFIKE